VLTQFRAGVAEALEGGGVKAKEYVGELVTPPCAVVVPSEPYLELMPAQQRVPFGTYRLAVDVLVISGLSTAKTQADAMDALLEKALTALDAEYDVQSVTRPGVITLKGAKYLASTIRVEEHARMGAS
jgi:hypothetical protein